MRVTWRKRRLMCMRTSRGRVADGEGKRQKGKARAWGASDTVYSCLGGSMSYRLIEKQVIFSGTKVRLELHHLENDDGVRVRREVCVHPGAVVVLPVLDDGRVVL